VWAWAWAWEGRDVVVSQCHERRPAARRISRGWTEQSRAEQSRAADSISRANRAAREAANERTAEELPTAAARGHNSKLTSPHLHLHLHLHPNRRGRVNALLLLLRACVESSPPVRLDEANHRPHRHHHQPQSVCTPFTSLHFSSPNFSFTSPHIISPPPQGVCTSGLVVVRTLHRRLFLLLATSLFTQHSLLLQGWMECRAVSSGNTKFLHFSNVASTLPANEQRPACHGISQRLLGRAEQSRAKQSKAKQSKHADKEEA